MEVSSGLMRPAAWWTGSEGERRPTLSMQGTAPVVGGLRATLCCGSEVEE